MNKKKPSKRKNIFTSTEHPELYSEFRITMVESHKTDIKDVVENLRNRGLTKTF